MTPAALVVNPRARSAGGTLDAAREALGRAGVRLVRTQEVEDAAGVRSAVADALEAGARLIVVGGGDGTLSAAADALLGRDATLAVLPLGTANDFARNLGIPEALEDACAVAARGGVREVDVGLVGGHAFLNAASVGVSSVVTERIDDGLKRAAGPLAYPVAAASAAVSQQPFRLHLEFDGGNRDASALQLVVGNGRYHGGGREVHPEARIDDRRLDAWYVEAASSAGGEPGTAGRLRDLGRLARVALLLRRGRHTEHGNVQHLRTRALRVVTEPPLDIDVDGELSGRTPVDFSISPARLRVRVPAGGESGP